MGYSGSFPKGIIPGCRTQTLRGQLLVAHSHRFQGRQFPVLGFEEDYGTAFLNQDSAEGQQNLVLKKGLFTVLGTLSLGWGRVSAHDRFLQRSQNGDLFPFCTPSSQPKQRGPPPQGHPCLGANRGRDSGGVAAVAAAPLGRTGLKLCISDFCFFMAPTFFLSV